MLKTHIGFGLIGCVLAACNQQKSKEDTADQTIAAVDTIYLSYTPSDIQLDSLSAYVYNPEGLPVYEVTRDFKIDKTVGHIPYRGKVNLYGFIKRDEAGSTIMIDGLKGYYTLTLFNNAAGYMYSGYLSIFPAPTNATIESYFGKSKVKIPGMKMQELWLLANEFEPGLRKVATGFPSKALNVSLPNGDNYAVKLIDGQVVSIVVSKAREGCLTISSFEIRGGDAFITSDCQR